MFSCFAATADAAPLAWHIKLTRKVCLSFVKYLGKLLPATSDTSLLSAGIAKGGGKAVRGGREEEEEDYGDYVTRCICGYTHDDGFMVQCDDCR